MSAPNKTSIRDNHKNVIGDPEKAILGIEWILWPIWPLKTTPAWNGEGLCIFQIKEMQVLAPPTNHDHVCHPWSQHTRRPPHNSNPLVMCNDLTGFAASRAPSSAWKFEREYPDPRPPRKLLWRGCANQNCWTPVHLDLDDAPEGQDLLSVTGEAASGAHQPPLSVKLQPLPVNL